MKSAFEMKFVKGCKAVALIHNGEYAGRIVANYSDGGGVTATVGIWKGPLAEMPSTTGTAGGYGYDKFSAAILDALHRVQGKRYVSAPEGSKRMGSIKPAPDSDWLAIVPAAILDAGSPQRAFQAAGYIYAEVC